MYKWRRFIWQIRCVGVLRSFMTCYWIRVSNRVGVNDNITKPNVDRKQYAKPSQKTNRLKSVNWTQYFVFVVKGARAHAHLFILCLFNVFFSHFERGVRTSYHLSLNIRELHAVHTIFSVWLNDEIRAPMKSNYEFGQWWRKIMLFRWKHICARL